MLQQIVSYVLFKKGCSLVEIREIIERLLKEKDSFYDKNELEAILDDVISKIEKIPDYDTYIYRGASKKNI